MCENKKLVLYSTTRQYNPGDEFIHFGIMNLLQSIGIKQNPVIFNRNQEINQPLSFLNPLRKVKSQSKLIKIFGTFLRISQVDNSFKDIHDLNIYDMVVFAGSPEWASTRLNPLYKKLKNFNKPILYLGVGSFSENIDINKLKKDIIAKANIITYRNEELKIFFDNFPKAQHVPCPALLSVKSFDHKIKKGKIAVVFGVSNASKGNHVSNNAMNKMIFSYNELTKKGYNVEIVCHYIDEIPFAQEMFPDAQIHYSYDARDYEEIYKEFEYVITSRVHAIGICASLSIPGTLIAHDGRASTAKGFLANIIKDNLDDHIYFQEIEKRLLEIDKLSKKLKEHKKNVFNIYKELLNENLKEWIK